MNCPMICLYKKTNRDLDGPRFVFNVMFNCDGDQTCADAIGAVQLPTAKVVRMGAVWASG